MSLTQTLPDFDESVDFANRPAVEEVIALGADPEERGWGLRMLMVSRGIERIGDHASASSPTRRTP